VRRDPMAMIPFIGYNAGDYFGHWLKLGKSVPHRPRIFSVNWFRRDEAGKFVWPGYGENMRVLEWIVDRCQGRAGALETPLGWVPDYDDLTWTGLEGFSREAFARVMSLDREQWRTELRLQDELLTKLQSRLPAALRLRRDQLGLEFGEAAAA